MVFLPIVHGWIGEEEKDQTRYDIVPGPYRNLSGLVEDLISATIDMTDSDGDTVPDSVELVIGTDPLSEDTDNDKVTDPVEISLNTDPHKMDSNNDGLPDGMEMIGVPTDVDGDGISNAWDSDNDNDGLEDTTDLSPFSKTAVKSSFHLDLNTTSEYVYLSFQIRPQNPSHMNMMIGSYDWPYDDKAMMKDLDNSTEDMFINPIMKIKMSDAPDQDDVIDYGIVVDGDTCIIPMFPEREYGQIVALRGKMFIPAGEPVDLDLDLSFEWSVTANTDQKVTSIKASNGKYLSSADNGKPNANASSVSDHQGFVIEELGSDQIAFKAMNGNYIGTDGSGFLTASWNELGENCKFQRSTAGDMEYLITNTGKYLTLQTDGTLKTSTSSSGENSKFKIEDAGIKTQMINLITYPEKFSIVGLRASENFGTELGVFYGNDLEELLMSLVILSRDFMRNDTFQMGDMKSVLSDKNLTLDSIGGTYDHQDEALLDSINRISGEAVSALPDGSILPLITLIEDSSSIMDLRDLDPIDGRSFVIDLGNEPVIRSRMMKTTWYEAPSTDPLDPGELIGEVASWGLNRKTGTDTASLLLFWAIGDSTVISVGDQVTNWNVPEVNLDAYTIGMNIFNTAKWLVGAPMTIMGGFKDIIEIGAKVDILAKAGSYIGDGLKSIITALKIVKVVDTAKDILKFLDTIGPILDIIGLIIDYGIGVFNLIMICCSNGWDAFSASVATAQFMLQMGFSIVMFLIGLIPIVGTIVGIIMLIADLVDLILTWIPGVSGYQDIIMNWILGLVAGARTFCDLDLEIVTTSMNMIDKTSNGLDAGDRFEIESIVNTSVVRTRWGGEEDVEEGYIKPSYIIYIPSKPAEAGHTGTKWSKRGTYQNVIKETETDQSKDTQWEIGAYVEPGFGMVNYPVSTIFKTEYKVFYEEYNYVAFWFPGLWERKNVTDTDYSKMDTMYFDIMPENMDDLSRWGYLKRSDPDGDTLNASQETGTSPWKWDSDGDGLGDPYELEMGYDPTDPDTDLDGLNDRLEVKKGMDLRKDDTDDDGLTDYLELEGWVVNFTYDGTPFYWHIVSDPTLNDTDGDGLNDLLEFYCNLNPLSMDTDGNGTNDLLTDYTTIDIVEDEVIGDDESRKFAECNEMAVGPDGSFYIKGYSSDYLLKIDKDGYYKWAKKFTQWSDTYLDEVSSVFVGPNGTIYVGTYGWDGNIKLYLLDTNGNIKAKWYNNHIGTVSTMWVDEKDNVYTMGIGPGEWPYIVVFDPNGTELGYKQLPYGSGSTSIGALEGNSIAVNSFGDIFLLDIKNRVIHVYYPDLSVNFTWQVPQFGKPGDIFIDEEDNIYICDEDQIYDRIQVYDKNRRMLAEWNTGLSETSIYVGNDEKIYVGGNTGSGTYKGRIILFDMLTTLHRVDEDLIADDTDSDGLLDDEEMIGWLCNATTPDGDISEVVLSSPKIFDTDDDGLNDSYERDLATDPNSTDTDKDGLGDLFELENGTDPLHFDSDRDTLSDSLELAWGGDPLLYDTDGDGLSDKWEFLLGTNPRDIDTDDDGLSDNEEKQMGYDPLDPDPDRDSLFDGEEFDLGSSAYKSDNDGDGILDGIEIIYGTDPTSGDSDGDLLPDGFEIEMKLNPINNDTDGDGMMDSRELEIGYNPFSKDSDGDGIPDGSDLDFTVELENITFISDSTKDSDVLKTGLSGEGSVIINELAPGEAEGITDQYIVIVGKPSMDPGTSGNLILQLLEDTPDLLEAMNSSMENRCVVRYGIWSPNQTVILISKPLQNDHNRILGIFKSIMMSVESGHVVSDYMTPVGFINFDSLDLTRAVDAALFCEFNGNTTATLELTSLDESPIPMAVSSGIPLARYPINRFIQVDLTGDVEISWAELRIYYTVDDLDRNNDGDADDTGDIDESTLTIYRLENGTWMNLSSTSRVNTTDLNLNGMDYAGYIQIDLDHFSIFGIAGEAFEIGTYSLTVGPIIDENGTVLENVSVSISLEGFEDSSLSDLDGNTYFILARSSYGIPVMITLFKEGYQNLTYSTNITMEGLLETSPPPMVRIQEVIENITVYFILTVGPIRNETGSVLNNCRIVISMGTIIQENDTGPDGIAEFNLSKDLLGTDVNISISLDGYEPIQYRTKISMEGLLEEGPPLLSLIGEEPPIEKPGSDDDDNGNLTWIILAILVILLILISAIIIISRRSKPADDEE